MSEVIIANERSYYSGDEDGIINAIREAKAPENVSELQSFLGTAKYLRKFVPHFAELASPLYTLLRKGEKWNWKLEQQKSFEGLKEAIYSTTNLAHFDPTLPVTIHVDACAKGLGAVLLQENCGLQPVAFMSRTLTPTETRYAQIEREALAVVFGVTRFNQYLLGRKFTIKTDHRPLVKLLGCNDPIPQLVSTRIKNWVMKLSAYYYDIQYLEGKENVYADFLSRQPMENVPPSEEEMVEVQVLLIAGEGIVNAEMVKAETKNDPVLRKVIEYVRNGWPLVTSEEMKPFFSKRLELSVEHDILLWNNRVIVPTKLQTMLLQDLHAEHFGRVKMKQGARSYLWWPNLDRNIEDTVKCCTQCQEYARNPPSKSGTWSWPSGPWKRLHIDYAGPFQGEMFLVIVDAYTKYLEIVPLSNATSESTVTALRHLFSVFGIPEHVVSDNGTQFTGLEFKTFLRLNDVVHTLTAPGHPATNGLAERYVGIFKQKMNEIGHTGESLQTRLDRFLLAHRTTPTSNGKIPVELLMGRQVRTRFSALRFSEAKQQAKVYESNDQFSKFEKGDAVFVRNFGKGARWVPATITTVNSPYSYDVQVGDVIWKRHHNQMRSRGVPTADWVSESHSPDVPLTMEPPLQSDPTIVREQNHQQNTVPPVEEQLPSLPADLSTPLHEPQQPPEPPEPRRSGRQSKPVERLIEQI